MKRALIVGIDNYPSSPLTGCINDANELAEIIQRNGDGTPNFGIKLETNIQSKAVLKGLINDLFKRDSETALFYFSGHGAVNESGGYIVTPDHQRNDLGVSMDEMLIAANKSKAKNKVIILDCCYSGTFGSPQLLDNTAYISDGVTILTASMPNEYSKEINGHGVFTNLLLEALRGGAADLNGHITPGSIYSYIDQALGEWEQRPVFKTNISEFIKLRIVQPQVSLNVIRKLTEYFPTATDHYQLDPSYEDTNTLGSDHKTREPYANPLNVATFKDLQRLQSVGLVIPVDAEFMYYAAMESKACKLTNLGQHYWRLAKKNRI